MPTSLPTGPLSTRQSLADELRRLGLKPGDLLLVHSSLSSLGWVCGGAEAVVLALLDVLSNDGTLIVPSHSSDNSDPAQWKDPPVPEEWRPTIRACTPAYSPRTTRSRGMGVIAETVRTWPGAIRSVHPQTSFAAVGSQADLTMAGHALECRLGEDSPLARLEAAGAYVLLLGVGFDACTAFHLAEYRIPAPLINNSFAVATDEGRRWMTVRETSVTDARFDELGADFETETPITRRKVGGANARLFLLADAVAYAQKWLPVHRPGTA